MRRMNSALAIVQSADEGQPPARQSKIAQSIGYADAGVVVMDIIGAEITATDANNLVIRDIGHGSVWSVHLY